MYFNQIQNNLHISNENSNSLWGRGGEGGNGFHFTAMFIHRTTSSIKKIFKTLNGITIITIAIQYFTSKFEVIFNESKKQARNIV
jgi:hypothetical protein